MNAAELPPISELVPHSGEIVLLERVLEHDGESTVTRVVVGSRALLRREDGSVPSWLALEYMAQCAAAHEGILARAEGRPPVPGFLVRAVEFRFYRSRFECDELLRVRARRIHGRLGLGVLSHLCTIHAEGGGKDEALLAEGRLTVSLPGPYSTATDPASRS
jgi:predicted hotdog family 3-hydroxylacyl-ACP dehydratase